MELVKKIKLNGKEHLLNFPTKMKDHVAIGVKKSEFSEGKYWELLNLQTDFALFTFSVINCASVFDVIAPNLLQTFGGVDSVMDLEPNKVKILNDLYINEISDWFYQCEKEVFGTGDVVTEEENE